MVGSLPTTGLEEPVVVGGVPAPSVYDGAAHRITWHRPALPVGMMHGTMIRANACYDLWSDLKAGLGGKKMRLEDYFDFLAPNDIRVKGTRIGIETILTDYLDLGLFPEQIAARYRTLSLEQVYATLTYYWHNREQVEAYLRSVDEEIERQRQEQDLHPTPAVQRLRELARQREQQRSQVASPV